MAIDKKDSELSMLMSESTLLDNNDNDQAEENENDNQKTFSASPTPSPSNKPRPAPKATPAEQALQQRYKAIRNQLSQQMRPSWQNSNVKRIQKTLAKDSVLRDALFQMYRNSPAAFLTLTPKEQYNLVKDVSNHLKNLAQQCVAAQQQPIDPNDPTNSFNQANPNNLANQAQAAAAGVILEQDNQMLNIQQTEAVDDENNVADEETKQFTLTQEDEQEIAEHNQQYQNPRPQPGTSHSEDDDEQANEATTLVKDEVKIKGAESVVKNEKTEEKALESFIKVDKKAFIKAAKGMVKEVEAKVAEVAVKALAAG